MNKPEETLAEKHKARRMAGRRLLDLTDQVEANAETTPEEMTPEETTPVEEAPAETTPAETMPVGATPAETTPAETMPAETTPAETTPASLPPNVSSPDAPPPDVPSPDAPPPDVPSPDAPSPDTPPPNTLPPDVPSPDSPLPDGFQPDTLSPNSTEQMSLLQYVRTTSRQAWQGVRKLPSRFTGWVQDFRQRRADRRAEDNGPGQPPPGGEPPRRWQRAWAATRPFLWRGRVGPAFWTVASSLSLVVNIILIVILVLLGRQLFFLEKAVVSDKLIGGLYDNFVLMDQAHIQTTITVSDTIQVIDTIPVVFDLPLNQKTVVVLTKDTPVKNATIFLNNAAVPLDLILREGTELSIDINMTVPVQQSIPVVLNVPVNLQVPVDIPLNQTQLHQPFVGLQQVVSPYRQLLGDLPDSWGAVCKGPLKLACTVLRFK